MMTETYTIQDIAGMTGLNERTIRSYLADGLLKGEKTDGAWRFTAEQFGDFLRQDMVRASVQAKANAVVYDFLITDRRRLPDPGPALGGGPGTRTAGSSVGAGQPAGAALGLPVPGRDGTVHPQRSLGRAGRAAGPDEKLTQKHRKAP